jgi:hypothetical protein
MRKWEERRKNRGLFELFLRTLSKDRRWFRKISVAGAGIRGGIQTNILRNWTSSTNIVTWRLHMCCVCRDSVSNADASFRYLKLDTCRPVNIRSANVVHFTAVCRERSVGDLNTYQSNLIFPLHSPTTVPLLTCPYIICWIYDNM